MNRSASRVGQKPWAAAARALAGGCLLLAINAWAQPSNAPTVVEVRPGDTFSAIAARYTGDVGSWRQMYHPQLSGLRNPNRISVGMRFEVATDTSGNSYLRLLAPASPTATVATPAPAGTKPAGVAAAAVPVVTAARDDTLVVGVVPNIAAATLQTQYENLKRYLERRNAQKVRIVIPANFKAFFDSTMRGEYDLAVAAPHFARVAQLDRNHTPLVIYEPRINASLVAPIESAPSNARELRGKALAFANPQSLVAMYGQQWLATELKFEAGRDYEVKGARTDLGVGRMMLTGEAAAAIMSQGEYRALPADEAARLKVVEVFARIPNFIVLANPRLSSEQMARLRTQLKEFPSDSADGVPFARAVGVSAIVDADPAVLRELDPYAAPTRKAMGY